MCTVKAWCEVLKDKEPPASIPFGLGFCAERMLVRARGLVLEWGWVFFIEGENVMYWVEVLTAFTVVDREDGKYKMVLK